jgi:hypothetical protein
MLSCELTYPVRVQRRRPVCLNIRAIPLPIEYEVCRERGESGRHPSARGCEPPGAFYVARKARGDLILGIVDPSNPVALTTAHGRRSETRSSTSSVRATVRSACRRAT